MSIYKVLCPLYSYIFAKHIYIRININRPEVERMHVLYIFALRCPALKKGCCIDRQLIGLFFSEMSIYKVLCPLYSYIFAKHIYIRININRPEVERMHVLYIFALRCPSGRQKFMLVSLLTKHSEVSGGSN